MAPKRTNTLAMARTVDVKRVGLFSLVACLPVACFFLGMEFGRANSPDYSTEEAAFVYLASQIVNIQNDREDTKLALYGGPKIYEYSLKKDTLEIRPTAAFTLAGQAVERRWKTLEYKRTHELIGLSAAGGGGVVAAAGTLRDGIGKFSMFSQRFIYLGALVVAVGGGYFGYKLTYTDKADYDNHNFRRVLEDKKNWNTFAKHLSLCRTVEDLITLNDELRKSGISVGSGIDATYCKNYLEWAKAPLVVASSSSR